MRQQQMSSTDPPAIASTLLLPGAGRPMSEEQLVAILNQEMYRRRQEDQRVIEERRSRQMEPERLHGQSLESQGPRLVVLPTVASVSPVELSLCVDVPASGQRLFTPGAGHCTHSRCRVTR